MAFDRAQSGKFRCDAGESDQIAALVAERGDEKFNFETTAVGAFAPNPNPGPARIAGAG